MPFLKFKYYTNCICPGNCQLFVYFSKINCSNMDLKCDLQWLFYLFCCCSEWHIIFDFTCLNVYNRHSRMKVIKERDWIFSNMKLYDASTQYVSWLCCCHWPGCCLYVMLMWYYKSTYEKNALLDPKKKTKKTKIGRSALRFRKHIFFETTFNISINK